MTTPVWGWLAAGGTIGVLLVADVLTSRGRGAPTLRRSLVTSGAWITVSIAFGAALALTEGGSVAGQYFAGYLVEKFLSIDNIFVFALLFKAFAVPPAYQHRVLYFGVVGALLLRAGFIAAGAALLARFSFVLYLFGALLVVGGLRMLRADHDVDLEHNFVVRAVRRLVPVTPDYVGDHFVTRVGERRSATPLLVTLLVVEATDIVFATDSIPAIFGITRDVFVVVTSNAFAVLGLRALYFVLAGVMGRFRHLKYGLAALLVFIGAKLVLSDVVHVSTLVSFVMVAVLVGGSVLASIWEARRRPSDNDAGTGQPARR